MARQLPPGPPGTIPFGNLQDFTRDTLHYILDSRKYGDFVLIRFGPYKGFIAYSPELVHQVLVTDAEHFRKTTATKRALDIVVGQGLFTNDGDPWKRQRKLMQPVFHTRRIGVYGEVMVDFAEELLGDWPDGEEMDMDQAMSALTMRIIAKTLFDANVEDTAAIGEAVTAALREADDRLNRLILLPDWAPTKSNRIMREAMVALNGIIERFINDRRASGEDTGDLLSMLLMARDEDTDGQMTDKQVRDEAMTLFGAGHETTSHALSWTWYMLSQHPEVEARLHDELAAVLGGRAPTLEDLPQVPYTEQVIKEAMRLYPPAWITTREAVDDIEIAGYIVKKGEVVVIPIYSLHHDAHYFPEPERYDPDRFSPEREKDIPKYAYLPFGAGPRVCIGNAFAMMEARLIVATIAQKLTFTVAPDQIVEPQRMFTLRPKYGLRMIAHERVSEMA
ncbi:MAG TPA: cytochrome P450 [Candidatus Limnocylindrales bacterium]|nr:cytochrome P450 [Candidatus Limnocylindrales bacterium]